MEISCLSTVKIDGLNQLAEEIMYLTNLKQLKIGIKGEENRHFLQKLNDSLKRLKKIEKLKLSCNFFLKEEIIQIFDKINDISSLAEINF